MFHKIMTASLAFMLLGTTVLVAQETVTEKPTKAVETTTTKQDEEPKKIVGYGFTVDKSVDCTPVKSQDKTGTCWCFAGASFLESEMMRRGKGQHNISEMFIVKNVYNDKAQNYVLRHGKANFGQGALAHDFINGAGRHGFMPEEAYSGLEDGNSKHDHGEMEGLLKGILDSVIKQKRPSKKWAKAYASVMDTYLGKSPETFTYRGQSYTPKEFAKSMGFRAEDYVSLTSYNHHPFHKDFVLEIPDNNSNGSFHNVPIDDLVEVIDNAIENGYSVAWDGDVSERGFSMGNGIAILPKQANRRDAFKEPGEELEVTQEMRQETFHSYSTTDDHLMHLTGIARDKNGKKYYIIKNSWGPTGPYKGFLHMSEAYVRLKTVAIMLHKDAVPEKINLK